MAIDPLAGFAADIAAMRARIAELERVIARSSFETGNYVPTLTGAVLGIGSGPINTADWDLNGSQLIVDGNLVFGSTGATYPGTVTTLSLPPGFEFASILDPSIPIGECEINIAGTNYHGRVWQWSATAVRIVTQDVASSRVRTVAPGASSPAAWVSPSAIRYHYSARVRRT